MTGRGVLSAMETNHRNQMIDNIYEQHGPLGYNEFLVNSFDGTRPVSQAIMDSFNWSISPENNTYWANLWSYYSDVQRIKKIKPNVREYAKLEPFKFI